MSKAQEPLRPLSEIYQEFNERNIPPLRNFIPDFAPLGMNRTEVSSNTIQRTDCTTTWVDALEARLDQFSGGTNLTDPELIRDTLHMMGAV
jgi:hypothetical protein